MSLLGVEVYCAIDKAVTGGKVQFDPQYKTIGYLYCVETQEELEALIGCVEIQRGFGVRVEVHDVDEMQLGVEPPRQITGLGQGFL